MKVDSLVYASDREAAANYRPSVDARSPRRGGGGTVIPSGSALLPGVAILRYNSASRLWKATESSPFSSIGYSMNRARILGSTVLRKSATLGRGSSTSSDRKIYARGWFYRQDRPTRRTNLKSDVLVLLKNPSGVFEDPVHIFLSQLLEIRHSWLELFSHIALVLAETGSRSKGCTGLGSSAGGRSQETHCCNKSKACACIFFPLYRNINSENFYRAKRNVRTTISLVGRRGVTTNLSFPQKGFNL